MGLNKHGIPRMGGTKSKFNYLKRVEKHGSVCRYCARETTFATFSIDHVVPLSRGGTNCSENIVAACKECNRLKADHSVTAFASIFEEHYGRPIAPGPDFVLSIDHGRGTAQIKVDRKCRVCKGPVKSTDFKRIHTKCLMDEPFAPPRARADWNY